MAFKFKRSYWLYSTGIFVVWGLVFLFHWLVGDPPGLSTLSLIFVGYLLGWVSGTIARYVYK